MYFMMLLLAEMSVCIKNVGSSPACTSISVCMYIIIPYNLINDILHGCIYIYHIIILYILYILYIILYLHLRHT